MTGATVVKTSSLTPLLALLLLCPATSNAFAGELKVPADGTIRVAVVLAPHATVIDFTGPWEVFQDVMIGGPNHSQHRMPFSLFTVAESREPIEASAGLRIVPDYTFDDAPPPQVVVVPALRGSDALHAYLRRTAQRTDVVMSVCTGAFQLARAGLLDGKRATTHHEFVDALAKEFPEVRVQSGVRWVDEGKVATAAGLTSGIDLALHIVERYFGSDIAERTAAYMEHRGDGWREKSGSSSPSEGSSGH